jgi:hypothetical protein
MDNNAHETRQLLDPCSKEPKFLQKEPKFLKKNTSFLFLK